MIPAILLIAGLLLIYFEFFLPGGIVGTAGAILFIGALVLFSLDSDSILFTLLFCASGFILLFLTVRFALNRVKTGNPEDSVYLASDQEGYMASAFEADLIGKTGIVVSDLKPSGYVKIEGKKYQVLSKIGYLEKGTTVEVIGGEGAHLVVKPKE